MSMCKGEVQTSSWDKFEWTPLFDRCHCPWSWPWKRVISNARELTQKLVHSTIPYLPRIVTPSTVFNRTVLWVIPKPATVSGLALGKTPAYWLRLEMTGRQWENEKVWKNNRKKEIDWEPVEGLPKEAASSSKRNPILALDTNVASEDTLCDKN